MSLIQVMTKARRRFGVEYPASPTEYEVEVVKNKSISIFKKGVLVNTFALGDEAEHGSYNLTYTGRILSISEKTVKISDHMNDSYSGRTHMLSMNEFCWRNDDFDAAEVFKENADTMMYI